MSDDTSANDADAIALYEKLAELLAELMHGDEPEVSPRGHGRKTFPTVSIQKRKPASRQKSRIRVETY